MRRLGHVYGPHGRVQDPPALHRGVRPRGSPEGERGDPGGPPLLQCAARPELGYRAAAVVRPAVAGGPAAVADPGLELQQRDLVVTAAGAGASGYAAYLIDESVIQQDGNGVPNIRGPYCAPNAQAANRITIPFQDSDNHYADDSIAVADTDDVARASGYQLGGQIIDSGISVLGISNFDQGIRVANVILAENLRGNEHGDTRGTRLIDIETTHRLEHLRVGHLVLFSYQALGISLQLFRVEAIKPTTNYRRMTVTLRWHQDVWYTDAYGQNPAPFYSDPLKALPNRPPYPWHPFAEQPIAGDSIWDRTEWGFAIAQ